jgi:internalin A
MSRVVYAIVGLVCVLGPSAGWSDDPKQPPKPDDATVKAWVAAGAEFSWFRQRDGNLYVHNSPDAGSTALLPVFRFTDSNLGKIDFKTLPEPKVPYGIQFSGARKGFQTALESVAGRKNLAGLGIWECELTTIDLKVLAGFPQLTVLQMHGGYNGSTLIPEAALKSLKEFKRLAALEIHGMRLTDAGVQDLADLKPVRWLTASYTGLTDAHLKTLAGLPNLEALDLAFNPKITDAAFIELKGFGKLTTLRLNSTNISDAGLEAVKDLPKLEVLYLWHPKITDAGLDNLSTAKRLRRLYLDDGRGTTAAGVERLKKALPDLSVKK